MVSESEIEHRSFPCCLTVSLAIAVLVAPVISELAGIGTLYALWAWVPIYYIIKWVFTSCIHFARKF